jgi:hypothetical protein
VHEQYQGPGARTPAQTLVRFPLARITREFEAGILQPGDLIDRFEHRCRAVLDAGMDVVWSFKPDRRAVLTGQWRPFVEALARHLSTAGLTARVVVAIWHEPENDMSAAAFVALFNQVHDWLTAVNPAIVTCHSALGYQYRNMTMAQARAWVTRAGVHAIDLYSGRSFPLATTLQTSAPFVIWAASRPAGARWGVSERGWIADAEHWPERVLAIDHEAEYLRTLTPAEQPDFYVVWNTVGVENDPKIVLDSTGVVAVNDLFSDLSSDPCPLCAGTGRVPPGTTLPSTVH